MQTFNTSLLKTTLKKFQKQIPEFSDYEIQLEKQFDDINALINLYDQIYPLLEKFCGIVIISPLTLTASL